MNPGIIKDVEKQQNYIRDVYCKFWNKSRKKYGLEQYDEDLINLVSKNIPKRNRILDVGIGDGYPFASQLNNIGYQLYGIDLSPTHVAMVRKEFPNIIVDVGDAQSLKFPNKYFDGVYCFRSTWYIPDLELSINKTSSGFNFIPSKVRLKISGPSTFTILIPLLQLYTSIGK